MKRALLMLGIAALLGIPAASWAAGEYPIQVVPVGKGPYTFPKGYKTPWDKADYAVSEKLSPNLYVVHGAAGIDVDNPDGASARVTVLFGPDGVMMVDSGNLPSDDETLAVIRSFSQDPIKILVAARAHGGQTGNAFFAKHGAVIMGQENLRDETQYNVSPPGNPPSDPARIPVVTYKYDPATEGKPGSIIHMNGETVDLIPMMPARIAGDTIVRYEKANVLYINEYYGDFGYPFCDQANGGSTFGLLKAIDLIMKLADDDTILVPSHGELLRKKDLVPYRNALSDVLTKVKALRNSGKSLKEVLAMNLPAPHTGPNDKITMGDTQANKDLFITKIYNEVGGLPPIVNGQRKMPAPTE